MNNLILRRSGGATYTLFTSSDTHGRTKRWQWVGKGLIAQFFKDLTYNPETEYVFPGFTLSNPEYRRLFYMFLYAEDRFRAPGLEKENYEVLMLTPPNEFFGDWNYVSQQFPTAITKYKVAA